MLIFNGSKTAVNPSSLGTKKPKALKRAFFFRKNRGKMSTILKLVYASQG
jgi:hypothetical protein